MGILGDIIKKTPFYEAFRRKAIRKAKERQHKLEQELHPLRVAFYKQIIKEKDVVFDVGANVGNRVAALLECGARVIAVEPQPVCVNALKSKFADLIVVENIGLSEMAGELSMHISTDTTVSSFSQEFIDSTKDRFKYSKWVDTIKVPISTLDKLIAKHGVPKFCKVDVEGFELQVLKGLHQPIPFISLEYCVPEMQAQLKDCIHYLHELSPTGEFNYSIGESMTWALPNWLSFEDFQKHIETSAFIKTSFGDIYFKSNA